MDYTLPQHSLNLLLMSLTVPGWRVDFQDTFIAGQLVVDVLPELEAKPSGEVRQEDELRWCDKVVTFSLNEKQRAAVVKCLTFVAKDLPITRFGHTNKLLAAFGLGD